MPQDSPPPTLHWQGQPTRGDEESVLTALEPVMAKRYSLEAGRRHRRMVTYLDTPDGRLRKRGLELRHERASGAGILIVEQLATPPSRPGETAQVTGPQSTQAQTARPSPAPADATPATSGPAPPGPALTTTRLTEAPRWPARHDQFPGGEVRDVIAKAMWIRAVAPVAKGRLTTRDVAVRDEEGTLVAWIAWLEFIGKEPLDTPPLIRVVVRPEPGHRRDAKRITKALRKATGFAHDEEAGETLYEQLRRAQYTEPTRRRLAMSGGLPADAAVATSLLTHADAIADNVDGVRADIDTEFLHELRVAVRRTRSLLKLTGDVLPSAVVERYRPEFKWLGDVTTPTRDLDVYLLELDELAAGLVAGTAEDLAPFADHLRSERAKAQRTLVRTLGTKRFTKLLENWPSELSGVVGEPKSTADLESFVAQRVPRFAAKVLRKAGAITPESSSDQVHDLRKRCKELRYLLEFAKPVSDPAGHRSVLKELKRVQDILGAFQDGEVQSAALQAFGMRMQEIGNPPAATLLALGEVSARMIEQQRAARADLTDALARFAGKLPKERIEAMVS
ncbi:CHAD domain-containing protein [Saccharomonospora sp. NPDC006951]